MSEPRFVTSSFCMHGDCVAVASDVDGSVLVRATTEPSTVVRFTASEWDVFLAGARAGEFDRSRLG